MCVTQHTSHTSSTLFCSKSCRLCNDTTKWNLNNYCYDLKKSHTHTGKHEHTFPSVAQRDVSEDQNNKKRNIIRGTRDRETLQSAFQYFSVRVFEAGEVESFTLGLKCEDKRLITVMHQIVLWARCISLLVKYN